MIYGLGLLFVLLSLVLSIPAARKLLFMREINRHSAITTGVVTSTSSSLGWLWTSQFGSSTRPLINYQSPNGMDLNLEVVDSSMFTFHQYKPGMSVEVVFDANLPGRAYAMPEWKTALKDFWMGVGAMLAAVVMFVIGRLMVAL